MHPVAMAQGIDPIWFATLVVLVMILGTLTPPVGINLFTMKGIAKDIPIGTIYRGAMPFVLAAGGYSYRLRRTFPGYLVARYIEITTTKTD